MSYQVVGSKTSCMQQPAHKRTFPIEVHIFCAVQMDAIFHTSFASDAASPSFRASVGMGNEGGSRRTGFSGNRRSRNN